jgi:hypothetical protein
MPDDRAQDISQGFGEWEDYAPGRGQKASARGGFGRLAVVLAKIPFLVVRLLA